MQILVDIGNTRIKWAQVEDGRLSNVGNAVHRDMRERALASFVTALPKQVTRAIVANVAGDAIGRDLTELLRIRSRITPEFVAVRAEQFGVRCAYADPSRLGVDRWIAVLAAHHLAPGAACVIDAGTAVTFDAVDARGQHLGGLIVPGSRLLASSLDRNTSAIGKTGAPGTRPTGLDLLGKSTDAAVGNGAMLALTGALERAIAAVEESLKERPKVYLTGGDADALHGWLESEVDLRRDLVLEGLALFSDAPPGAHLQPKATHA
ncbi:MAG TPA: type III pantothenate kinase [Gammaproteobacteria bacterium]|nr:type III pantothenate kinase [Gammaproteobacteria bacterium]